MKNFWFITLTALLVIAVSVGWNIPLRIAVAANAVLILIDVAKTIWEACHGRKEKKN